MPVAFVLITVQAVLGGLDNLWHHEITERLPARRSAASELTLHSARELLYALLFLAFAWFQWHGIWSVLLAAALLVEVMLTIADFVVEDQTRRLPALERVLHTILAINYGATLAVLAPILISWWHLPSQVARTDHPLSWAFTLFGAAVFLWSVRDGLAALSLRKPAEWVRNPIAPASTAAPRTVLVSGATGFIGGHLVRRLLMRGDKVIVYTRRPDVALYRFGPHVTVVTDLDELDVTTRIHAIVNLAGSPILGLPWTRARRQQLLHSRVDTTRALTTFMDRLSTPVRVFVSASAIGFYGVHGDEILDEHAQPMPIFQSHLCQEWEAAARGAASLGARLVRLRIGLVLGADGGALPRLATPVRLGLGAILGTGKQWVSWIHIDDLVRLMELAIDNPAVTGVLNAVSSAPVTHRQFQEALARTLHRFIWLRVPGCLLRLALGEMAQLLVDGQRVVPSRATALGFRLRHPWLDGALRSILRPTAPDLSSAEVYFNGDCSVCRFEMDRYAAMSRETQPGMRFMDSTQQGSDLAVCSLRREHIERRVYVRSTDGSILSGMPAIVAIWASLPRYQLLSMLCSLPLLRPISVLLYDHIVAPTLAFWARRRAGHDIRASQTCGDLRQREAAGGDR